MSGLIVWHIPQVPMKPFKVPVDSPEEGAKVMAILAAYDKFQLDNNVKPDYSNAQGLLGADGDDWESEGGESVDDVFIDIQDKTYKTCVEASS